MSVSNPPITGRAYRVRRKHVAAAMLDAYPAKARALRNAADNANDCVRIYLHAEQWEDAQAARAECSALDALVTQYEVAYQRLPLTGRLAQ